MLTDQPATRQVSPVKNRKQSYDSYGDIFVNEKPKLSKAKLQSFGKNIVNYEPSGKKPKSNGYMAGTERYFLKWVVKINVWKLKLSF